MKVLVYFDKNELSPTGGPPGYLYNVYNKIVEEKIKNIDFLDSKSKRFKKIIKNIYKKAPKFIQEKYKHNRTKNYGELFYNRIFGNVKRESNIDFNKYDIIHFHSTCSLYMVQDSLKDYKGIVLLTSHSPKAAHLEIIDNIPVEEYSNNKSKYDSLETMDEFAFNRANYIMFPTVEAEECYYNTWKKYKKIHKDNEKKYIYLPTCINPVKIYESKEDIRAKYNIPSEAFVISFVGRHNEVKGYKSLKEIGKKVLKTYPNVYFLIGGKEEPLTGLNNKRWIEVGWTNKPHDLINASDLFILPNQETYFDLILLEVLSVGKTALITNTGGNKYFKKFKKSGIYFYEYNDIENACKIIGNIMESNLKNTDLLNKKIYEENFTMSSYIDGYEKLLEKIYKK